MTTASRGNGYLQTNLMVREGGYEASGFFEFFSLDGRFEPSLGSGVNKAMHGLSSAAARIDDVRIGAATGRFRPVAVVARSEGGDSVSARTRSRRLLLPAAGAAGRTRSARTAAVAAIQSLGASSRMRSRSSPSANARWFPRRRRGE